MKNAATYKNETWISESYKIRSDQPIYLVVKEERIVGITPSAYQMMRERWMMEANAKKRIIKDYVPSESEEEINVEVEKLRWNANKALILLHNLGQIDTAEKSSLTQQIDEWHAAIRQAAISRVEAAFDFYKVRAVNPEIDQIEQAKTLIDNAMKTNDRQAIMKLKLQYGGLLSKEHLYARRSESFIQRILETDVVLYKRFWELETLLRDLFDRYSHYLFTTLQTLLSKIESPEYQSSIMNLVSENEEIQRQACTLHERSKKRSSVLKDHVQLLRELSSNMNMILTQLNSMNDYMLKAIMDISKSDKPS